MLCKIIDRVELTKEQVVIYPRRGDTATYNRARSGTVRLVISYPTPRGEPVGRRTDTRLREWGSTTARWLRL